MLKTKHFITLGLFLLTPITLFASTQSEDVFFVTNRLNEEADGLKPPQFGAQRSPTLSWGRWQIQLNDQGRRVPKEVQYVFNNEERRNIQEDVYSHPVVLSEEEFFYQMRESAHKLNENPKEGLVYIHGYANVFDVAATRIASLTAQLNCNVVPIFFSWPSNGRAGFYPQDQENSMYSARHLMEFLEKLRTQSGLSRIHIIAHSIGSRLLLRVLTLLGVKHNPRDPKPFGKISFLAPDVDEGEFLSWIPEMKNTADRISIYGARDDQALTLSMSLFGLPRLGLFRPGHFISADGIDTIDVTDENFGILGHSYFINSPKVIEDLRIVLTTSLPPSERGLIMPLGTPVWEFSKPETAARKYPLPEVNRRNRR